jgi:hypothetical protein
MVKETKKGYIKPQIKRTASYMEKSSIGPTLLLRDRGPRVRAISPVFFQASSSQKDKQNYKI